MTAQTRLVLEGLQLWGCHGALEEEQARAQGFELDVILDLPRVEQDDLTRTVDYCQVLDTLHRLNESRHFRLIEVWAHEAARALLARFPGLLAVRVRVKKRPALPVGVHLRQVWAEAYCQRATGSPPTSG